MEERVPEIRFKGFDEGWLNKKIASIFTITRGYVLPTALTNEHKTEETPYPVFSSQTKDQGLMGYYRGWLYENAITWTTDGANAGTVCYRSGKFYCTNVCGVLLSNQVKANKMIAEALNKVAKKYVSYVGNPKLMNNVMAEIDVSIPLNIPEQDKISNLFNNLDTLISLTQQKLTQLKTLKKACLEKMFPKEGETVPEIRFQGFEGPWENKNLSELATMHARIGWQNLRTSEFMDNGDYMLITGTDFEDGQINYSTCHYVKQERYDQDKNIQVRNGSILVTKDGTLGKVAFVQGLSIPATLNAGVFNIIIKDDVLVSNNYLFQYLKAPFLMEFVNKKATGGTIKHLNQSLLVDFPVKIPSKKEQEKIGVYLNNLDRIIFLYKQKLDKLKNLKKALLDKMFV